MSDIVALPQCRYTLIHWMLYYLLLASIVRLFLFASSPCFKRNMIVEKPVPKQWIIISRILRMCCFMRSQLQKLQDGERSNFYFEPKWPNLLELCRFYLSRTEDLALGSTPCFKFTIYILSSEQMDCLSDGQK